MRKSKQGFSNRILLASYVENATHEESDHKKRKRAVPKKLKAQKLPKVEPAPQPAIK